MKYLLILISITGLLLTVIPSFLVFSGLIEFTLHTRLAFIGTLMWFLSAPFWMKAPKVGE